MQPGNTDCYAPSKQGSAWNIIGLCTLDVFEMLHSDSSELAVWGRYEETTEISHTEKELLFLKSLL